jgi:hypothetical protein
LTAGTPVGFLSTKKYKETIKIVPLAEISDDWGLSKHEKYVQSIYTVVLEQDDVTLDNRGRLDLPEGDADTLQGKAYATSLDHWVTMDFGRHFEMLALHKSQMPFLPWDMNDKCRVAKHCVVDALLNNGHSWPVSNCCIVGQFITDHYVKGLSLVLTQDHEFKQLFETWSQIFFPMGADHILQFPSNADLVHYKQAVLALNAFFESFNAVKLADAIQEQLKAMNQHK